MKEKSLPGNMAFKPEPKASALSPLLQMLLPPTCAIFFIVLANEEAH